MTHQQTPKLRRAPLPRDGLWVLRGLFRGTDLVAAIRFRDRYPGWNEFGLSAFLAEGDVQVESLCRNQLEPWHKVAIFEIADLRSVGLKVHPTFRTPHVTITHKDLGQLINLLNHVVHDVIDNPYHERNS